MRRVLRIFLFVLILMFAFCGYVALRLTVYPEIIKTYQQEDGIDSEINFYGLVVDAAGKPMPGVKGIAQIRYFPRSILFYGSESFGKTWMSFTTDENGRFALEGYRGRTLSFDIPAQGKTKVLDEALPHYMEPQLWAFEYRRDAYLYIPDPSSPAIFPMIAEGEQPTVWPCRGGKDRMSKPGDPPVYRVNQPFVPETPTVHVPYLPGRSTTKPTPMPPMYRVPGYTNALSPEKDNDKRAGNIQQVIPDEDAKRRGDARTGPVVGMLRDPETPEKWISGPEYTRKVTTRPALSEHLPSGATPPPEEYLVPNHR